MTDATDASDAYAVLGQEDRLQTLVALARAEGPLSFGELRERVGVSDPGRFNYHLGELRDRFVVTDEDTDGYRLTVPGRRLAGAVLGGIHAATLEETPREADGECLACGGGLETHFEGDRLRLVCPDCGQVHSEPTVPAGALAATDAAPDTVAERWAARNHASARHGFCPTCDGPMDRRVLLAGTEAAPDWLTGEDATATVRYGCDRCGEGWFSLVSLAVLQHPAVAGRLYTRGVDVRRLSATAPGLVSPGDATVRSRDPVRVAVEVDPGEGATPWTVVVDERCEVRTDASRF